MRILLSALLSLLLVACASVGGPNAGGVPLYVYVSEPAPDGGGRDAIILWSEAPPQCRSFDPEAKRATYHFRKVVADNPHVSGLVLEGCYVIRNGFVAMSFINGARGANPFGDFKPAQDGKTEPERAA